MALVGAMQQVVSCARGFACRWQHAAQTVVRSASKRRVGTLVHPHAQPGMRTERLGGGRGYVVPGGGKYPSVTTGASVCVARGSGTV